MLSISSGRSDGATPELFSWMGGCCIVRPNCAKNSPIEAAHLDSLESAHLFERLSKLSEGFNLGPKSHQFIIIAVLDNVGTSGLW